MTIKHDYQNEQNAEIVVVIFNFTQCMRYIQ